MHELTEPKHWREWAGRVATLPVLFLVLAVLAAILTEMQTHWIERSVGATLMSNNAERPESGTIWEKGRKSQSARTAVEKLASDRESQQRMARNAGSLAELIGSLAPGQGVMISAEHFRELYQKIPPGFAAAMISPFELLRAASEGRWIRVYLEMSAEGLVAYLLEPNNQVLRQFRVAPATLAVLARRGVGGSQTLEDLAGFQNRIYPADRFFAALASLPEEERRGLVPQPERLLEVAGQISRVGISDEAVAGFVELGFETRSGPQRRVLLLQGQDWAVLRLRSLLESKGAGSGKSP